MSVKVTVVIPCYNDGLYLREALNSVQSYDEKRESEIIVIDDGSTDQETKAVLLSLEGSGCSIVRQHNRGPAAARNAGTQRASAPYILPLDSDNRIRADCISEGVRVLDANSEVAVAYGDAEYFGLRSGRRRVPDFSVANLVVQNYLDTCAVIRKAALMDVGGYDEKMRLFGHEDWDLWLRLAARGWKFWHIPQVLFEYRVRTNSFTSRVQKHYQDMCGYIFSKPELEDFRQFREVIISLKCSKEYRLGKSLLHPPRAFRRLLRSIIPN